MPLVFVPRNHPLLKGRVTGLAHMFAGDEVLFAAASEQDARCGASPVWFVSVMRDCLFVYPGTDRTEECLYWYDRRFSVRRRYYDTGTPMPDSAVRARRRALAAAAGTLSAAELFDRFGRTLPPTEPDQ